jgi:hypothetical protein
MVFFGGNIALIFPSFDFRTSEEGWLDIDLTVTKPFLQVSWNADGVLPMAQTHFQTRRKNIACHPSTGTVFVDHRLRIHVYVLETSGLRLLPMHNDFSL